MGSLVVKLDNHTTEKLKNNRHYSDVDVLRLSSSFNGGDIPMTYDTDAVRVSVRNILMWRVGENVIRPEFGHNIHRSMYEQMNQFNKDRVCEEIKRAIEENEPRAKVKSVAVRNSEDNGNEDNGNTLHVRVVYSVVGDKSEDAEFVQESQISVK